MCSGPTLDLVDDNRQPGLLGLGQERAKLTIGVQCQGSEKTLVVEIEETALSRARDNFDLGG
jgi:hypothetical protein